MSESHFDLVIIGSGSGNSLVTPEFQGRQVAVVEAGTFGGTCLNVGCIPTKMLVYAAEMATAIRGSARYGVDSTLDQVRWTDIRDRVFGRIDPISAGGEHYRVHGPDTTAYLGWARFTGPRALEVTGLRGGGSARLTGEQVVIATGAAPIVPEVVRSSGVAFETSDTVMRIERLPASLLILGGGYIAAEFAHVFSALGVQVTLLTRGPALLRTQDEDVSAAFTALAQEAWDVHLGVEVTALSEDGDGVRATLTDGTQVSGEMLLVATGRAPRTQDLGLEHAGVATHEDGRVVADEHGRTTAEGVWTLGDVSSPYQLKHVANQEARVVAHNLAHPQDLRSVDHRAVPSGVFTHPQIASVGLTEAEAREAGHDVLTSVQAYGDTAYGWAMEDTTSFVKLVAERGGGRRLLGAHLLGPHATTLIQPLIQAVTRGEPVEHLAREQYWIHPALSEVVENALLGLDFEPA